MPACRAGTKGQRRLLGGPAFPAPDAAVAHLFASFVPLASARGPVLGPRAEDELGLEADPHVRKERQDDGEDNRGNGARDELLGPCMLHLDARDIQVDEQAAGIRDGG